MRLFYRAERSVTTRVQKGQSPASRWTVGKTQNDGLNDYEALHDVQDGYVITPLSQWRKSRNVTPVIDSKVAASFWSDRRL